jgi:hypothetical protein
MELTDSVVVHERGGSSVLGRLQNFSCGGSAAEYRKWARRSARKKRSALARVRTLVAAPDHAAAIEAANSYSMWHSSDQRLPGLINALYDAPAAVFWPVLLHNWTMCDDTSRCLPDLLVLIRAHVAAGEHPAKYWDAEAFGFREALSAAVTVYRGCSRSRVDGISWTIDRSVADNFARGHRFIPVPDPVIATGTIARDLILAVFIERNEKELLIDPRDLKDRAIISAVDEN